MRRLPKMAAALLAAALAVSAALPALAADQRAELELEASVRCTGEAADETLTVRLTALDGAPMPEGCDDEAELDFPARDCRAADDKTLTKTFDTIVYTAPGIYEYTVTQDAGGRKRADYDDTVFSLKVMVAWDTDGELKGHVSVRRDGDDGAKTELLFRNSYRSTDPLPPPVTPKLTGFILASLRICMRYAICSAFNDGPTLASGYLPPSFCPGNSSMPSMSAPLSFSSAWTSVPLCIEYA